MRVPFFEVRHTPERRAELHDAARRVIDSGQYILGREVEDFETHAAAFLGVQHAVGVSSGTDALIAALLAHGIGPGDEVIVPAFTFVATATAVARVGARPVFVDVRDDDLTIDTESKVLLEPNLASISVSLFGATARHASSSGLVIHDAAQAFGSFYGGAGTVCHSFFPTKNLAGFGDGGLVTTGDSALAERLQAIRVHGATERNVHRSFGGNFRLDALQAALLRVQLRHLPYDLTARRENAIRYHAGLQGIEGLRLPPAHFMGVPNQFVIRVASGKRCALRSYLAASGIGTEIYYPTIVPDQPCFPVSGHFPVARRAASEVLALSRGDFPVARRAASEVLALPIFPGLRAEEIEYVCSAVKKFFA